MQTKTTQKSFDGVIRRQKNSVIHINLKRKVVFSGFKMFGVFTLALFVLTSLSSVGSTVSYFSDTEVSTENRLQAGILGFNLSAGADYEARVTDAGATNIGTEQFEIETVPDENSLEQVYELRAKLDDSNEPDCSLMTLDAVNGDYHYQGLVVDFISPKQVFMDDWYFTLTLPTESSLPSLASCKGVIKFTAGLANALGGATGAFSDEKFYSFELLNWESSAPAVIESLYVHTESSVVETESVDLGEETPEAPPAEPTEVEEVVEEKVEETPPVVVVETPTETVEEVPPPAEAPAPETPAEVPPAKSTE